MALDPGLLEILACPDDKGPLRYLPDEGILYNPRLGRSSPYEKAFRCCSFPNPQTSVTTNEADSTS